MLNRPSRTKSARVIPNRMAVSTARLDGAPTAASTLIPAIRAFCTNSKLARPLTSSTESFRGTRPSRTERPASLSTALCRPTSSRTSWRLPSASNRAAACRPPVRSKTGCVARRVSGSFRIVAVAIVGRSRGGSAAGGDQGVHGCLAAHAAARCQVEVPRLGAQIYRSFAGQRHSDRIFSGRAHGDRQVAIPQTDLQRSSTANKS